MQRPSWATDDVDLSRPSVARVYDYFLGGSHHFEVDRQLAAQLLQLAPDTAEVMRSNRSFLRRVVQFMVGQGIDQFLDIGSGIPTVGNVHEIAQQADPAARVVYVDRDPVAVAHSRHMLTGNPNTAVIGADLVNPGHILGAPEVALLDLSRPVGLLCVAVLHFIPEAADPYSAMDRLRAAIAPGSLLAISHGTPGRPETETVTSIYQQATNQFTFRTPEQILRFFGDFTLVEPGLVAPPLWRPDAPDDVDDHPERSPGVGGVASKA